MTPKNLNELFARLATQNPNPQTELAYTNSYTLLVAVMLSAQSTDTGVNKATKDLFPVADTPQKMLGLGLDGLVSHIKTIGLYPTKAKNIIAMSQILINRFEGQIPRSREDLESLPGVGRKTANVVLNVAFQEPTIPVDTHIFRVANRLKLACGKTPLEVEKGLEKAIPEKFRVHAHHWLILHGRYVCKARVPQCPTCVLNDLCPYEPKTKA
ncbi:MAG: endonuclease III [Alphaproteobacteria bacterium]|jgi:endonuclease-3|nr:endonuclease III [Alphaproteobacteria bacterium]